MADEIKNEAVKNEYGDDQIQVLEGLEAVRVRPGMYIGTTSERGLHHLIYEIVDNSIDEALAGYCKDIEVTLEKDGSCTVRDDGRGVPSGIHPTQNLPTLQVIFTILHAGGKFGGGGYQIAGGLHGVGASVVNALSKRMEVINYRDGHEYTISFEKGNIVEEFKMGKETDKHGLTVRFYPDDEIFETVEFQTDIVRARLREQAFLNAGVSLTLIDKRTEPETKENYCYEGGIRSFVEYERSIHAGDTFEESFSDEEDADAHDEGDISNGAEEEEKDENNKSSKRPKYQPVHEDVIYVSGQRDGSIAEVALQYNTSYNEHIISFANNMHTIEGGTHETGFKQALTKVITNYARKIGELKDTEKFAGEDVREGLIAIISVKLENAQFESQTKAKLGNSHIRTLVDNIMTEKLTDYFEENPQTGRAVVIKAKQAMKTREEVRKARESSRKSIFKNSVLPGKLSDCQLRSVDLTELYIVEGNSAGGTAKDGRNSKFQAILPLRGKVLNVEKSRPDKVYINQSLLPIIQALGCGIGESFDPERLRYGKIIIMADADVDGSHIRILILTFLFRYMRKLIEDGHVYLAQPPLYKVFRGKQVRYAFSDEERDREIAELGTNGVEAERYKGLGEMDASQLWETTMDPERRTLLKVTMEDAEKCSETFSVLMGDNVDPRRLFIEENAKYAENLDI